MQEQGDGGKSEQLTVLQREYEEERGRGAVWWVCRTFPPTDEKI